MLGLSGVGVIAMPDLLLDVMLVEDPGIPAISDPMLVMLAMPDVDVVVAMLVMILTGSLDMAGESGQGNDSDFLFSLFSL